MGQKVWARLDDGEYRTLQRIKDRIGRDEDGGAVRFCIQMMGLVVEGDLTLSPTTAALKEKTKEMVMEELEERMEPES